MRKSNHFLCADNTLLTYDEWRCMWTDKPGLEGGTCWSARGYDGWPIEANGDAVEGNWYAVTGDVNCSRKKQGIR